MMRWDIPGLHFWHLPKNEGKKLPASHFHENQLNRVRAWSWCESVPDGWAETVRDAAMMASRVTAIVDFMVEMSSRGGRAVTRVLVCLSRSCDGMCCRGKGGNGGWRWMEEMKCERMGRIYIPFLGMVRTGWGLVDV